LRVFFGQQPNFQAKMMMAILAVGESGQKTCVGDGFSFPEEAFARGEIGSPGDSTGQAKERAIRGTSSFL
jgi:hypothetical protein